jgi:hypothetical protein
MITQEEILKAISNLIQSGSNATGRWIKFGDGTMIQTRDYLGALSAAAFTAIALPIAFVDNGYVVEALWDYETSVTSSFLFTDGSVNTASAVYIRTSTYTGANGHIHIVAIGRWK